MKNKILTSGKNIYFLVLDVNVTDLKLPSKYYRRVLKTNHEKLDFNNFNLDENLRNPNLLSSYEIQVCCA